MALVFSGGPMSDQNEAVKLRAEIAEAKPTVKQLTGQIRHREGRLRRIVVDAFNNESEPRSGMAIPVGQVVLGVHPCEESPIGVCAFDKLTRVQPLPYQRDPKSQTPMDGCLFCGKRCGVPWPYLRKVP
jgi:hypothetical protein